MTERKVRDGTRSVNTKDGYRKEVQRKKQKHCGGQVLGIRRQLTVTGNFSSPVTRATRVHKREEGP